MGLTIPNSFASKTSAQLSDLDENFTYLKTEIDPYVDNILVDESGQVTIGGGVVADVTGNLTGDVTGNAGTVTNGVYTTGDQTIGGNKTFSSTIIGSIDGNAVTVTNGVYTTNFSGSNQNLATRGYQKLPGGLILQWGTDVESTTVNFPIEFPTACLNVVASRTPTGDRGADMTVSINSRFSFSLRLGGTVGDDSAYWQAIGY